MTDLADVPDETTPLAPCWACRQPLRPGSLICTECDQWQNWRRLPSIPSTVLALLIALITVGGAFGPVIKSLIFEPKISIATAIALRNECLAPKGCNAENSPFQTHFDLKLTNYGGADVVLADYLTCNNAVERLGDLTTGEDWVFPRFITTDTRFIKIGDTAKMDYAYAVYQTQDRKYYGSSAMYCAVEIKSHPGKYVAFEVRENEFFMELGLVELKTAIGTNFPTRVVLPLYCDRRAPLKTVLAYCVL